MHIKLQPKALYFHTHGGIDGPDDLHIIAGFSDIEKAWDKYQMALVSHLESTRQVVVADRFGKLQFVPISEIQKLLDLVSDKTITTG
jgi:hypothetical protein